MKKDICGSCKGRENQRGTREGTNNQSSPMRRRVEPMEEQNKLNEEKDINTQRQETEVVTRREKVGNQEYKKTKRDCHQTETYKGKIY